MKVKLYRGDCLEVMKRFKRNFFDSVITDPPYALNFMNHGWDEFIPAVEYWEEMLRVSKPGAILFSFGGTRTYHRLMCNIEDAGWQIKDCLCWLQGEGFPKSLSIGKFEKSFVGYGTCLKPAWEPIIFAMKPLEGTYEHNAKKWKVAGLNIDDCRVSVNGKDKEKHLKEWDRFQSGNAKGNIVGNMGLKNVDLSAYRKEGRFPANLILGERGKKELDRATKGLTHKAGNISPLKGIVSDSIVRVLNSKVRTNYNVIDDEGSPIAISERVKNRYTERFEKYGKGLLNDDEKLSETKK